MTTPARSRQPCRIAVTLGDVAGIGPEVVLKALTSESLPPADVVVVGDPHILRQTAERLGCKLCVETVALDDPQFTAQILHGRNGRRRICCWNPSDVELSGVESGTVSAAAGHAAYDWLIAAADAALSGTIDALVTAPLSKAALHRAGLSYPGHTEILAERCGVRDVAMMLHLPPASDLAGEHGLSVAHVTLHTSIASVPGLLTTQRIAAATGLMDEFLEQIGCTRRAIGVCALNPHGGEDGLFGDEEARIIGPAVALSQSDGKRVDGPFPADTLLGRAAGGEFDGVIAMYHDQGHIALKLIGFGRAVNVTLGLPIIRTSPSHGTAFDIAGTGVADPAGMSSAIRAAVQLVESRRKG